MIVDSVQADSVLTADICLIGGGPAAIVIALELQKTGVDILMLVGGGEARESSFDQDLHRGVIARPGSHEDLVENRRRVFGGASTAWGGRCIPFDPIDFKSRSWIPESGWPFSYEEIEDYFRKATQICRAGAFDFDARSVFPNLPPEIVPGMDNEEIESWHLERWSPPVNFADAFRADLESAPNIRVLMDAHVTGLIAEAGARSSQPGSQTVSVAQVVRNEAHFQVRAKKFILATGGIENARLLLASQGELHPQGLGNHRDLVGRFYMCHAYGVYASVSLRKPQALRLAYERDSEGVYCRRRWRISDQAQTGRKIGNVIFFLDRPDSTQGHRDALFSFVFVAKSAIQIVKAPGLRSKLQQWRKHRSQIGEHLGAVVKGSLHLVPTLAVAARARLAKDRRLPSLLPGRNTAHWGVRFQAEQVPNRNSRITLSTEEKDALGMPRAVVNLEFSEQDTRTVLEAHEIFRSRFQAANVGDIACDEQGLVAFMQNMSVQFNSAAHHLGTTRMAVSDEHGVVDPDCKVFGTDNLYVAGSSVFPTGGHANPTLTILALALRLAGHLAGN